MQLMRLLPFHCSSNTNLPLLSFRGCSAAMNCKPLSSNSEYALLLELSFPYICVIMAGRLDAVPSLQSNSGPWIVISYVQLLPQGVGVVR